MTAFVAGLLTVAALVSTVASGDDGRVAADVHLRGSSVTLGTRSCASPTVLKGRLRPASANYLDFIAAAGQCGAEPARFLLPREEVILMVVTES